MEIKSAKVLIGTKQFLSVISRILLVYWCRCCSPIGWAVAHYLTIRLFALDFYEVIVDEAETNWNLFQITVSSYFPTY